MNKLVSKNPVLRFKLGRKIVKADGGLKFVEAGRTTMGRKIWANTTTGELIESNVDPNSNNFKAYRKSLGKSYNFYNLFTGRGTINGMDYIRKPITKTPEKKLDYSFMKGGTNLRSPEAEALLKDKKVLKYLKRQESLGFTTKPTPKKVITPTSQKVVTPHFQSLYKNLMQQRGITADQIIEWQNKLKDFYDPNAKYKSADGIWGLDTETAYLRYLSSKNIPTYTKAELPNNTPATPATPTILEEPVLPNDFASQKSAGYPSSLSRGEQLLNNITLRPEFKYSYGNYRNFNPIKPDLRPMFKQGGQLVSRNPVKRFKLKNFRLVAQ